MSVSKYRVANKVDASGKKTGIPGDMYIVKLSYKRGDETKYYAKRGFATKKQAQEHESEMRAKFANPAYNKLEEDKGNMLLSNYLDYWITNLAKDKKASTLEGYQQYINYRIKPNIGHAKLNQITPRYLDDFFNTLLKKENLANNTVRNIRNILSAALKVAVAYGYIEQNPVRNTITSIKDNSQKAAVYRTPELGHLLDEIRSNGESDNYEFFTVLAGLYGLRRREALGFQWSKVNWDNNTFTVDQSLTTPKTYRETGKIIESTKTQDSIRVLPITKETKKYFQWQYTRYLNNKTNDNYTDHGLAICRKNGEPYNPACYSSMYPQMIKRIDMPKLTIQGLRRSTASNLHAIKGSDPFTISRIMGHTIKGMDGEITSHGVSSVTYRYIDVAMEKKLDLLKAYHIDALNVKNIEKARKDPIVR